MVELERTGFLEESRIGSIYKICEGCPYLGKEKLGQRHPRSAKNYYARKCSFYKWWMYEPPVTEVPCPRMNQEVSWKW